MSRSRRRFAVGAVAALAVVVPASLAWACVAPVSLTTSSPTVQPGGVVHIIGRETAPGAPIEIHLDAPNGPLLTTITGQPGGMTSKWEADVTIPSNTQYGTHVLYAVQNYRNMNATIPKATIYVGTEPAAPPAAEARAGSLDVGSGPSGMSLVLLGLGVAAAGLLVVGGISVLAGSTKKDKPEAEPVKTS
jgi:hypothetical protein